MAYQLAGPSPDLNAQVDQLAQMAIQSGDHLGFFQRYLMLPTANRLAAQIAQGVVNQQVQGVQTQQALQQYNPQQPTVLDQLQQQQMQGLAAMPIAEGMFHPSVYTQGGIGAGLGDEEPQDQAQMARGGIVAFAGEGPSLVSADEPVTWGRLNPGSPLTQAELDAIAAERLRAERYKPSFPGEGFGAAETPEAKAVRDARIAEAQKRAAARLDAEGRPAASEASRPAPAAPAEPPSAPTKDELKTAERIKKFDDRIKETVNKGKDPSKLIAERAKLVEGINAGRSAPTVAPSGIAAPGPTAGPTVEAVTPKPIGAVPAAGAAAIEEAATKPSLLQRGLGAIKTGASRVTGIGAPAGEMGVARTVLNRAGALAIPATIAYEVGDRLKDTPMARWLQDVITPESPEEQYANMVFGRAPIVSGQPASAIDQVLWPSILKQESGGKHFRADKTVQESEKGAVGIAQVLPKTGPEAAKLAGLPWDENRLRTDPAYNEALGKAYFNKQLSDFGGDIDKALSAYNFGPGATRNAISKSAKEGRDWKSYIPSETKNYIASIRKNVDKTLGDVAAVAPQKPAVVRAKEIVENLPANVVEKMTDGGQESFFRGLTYPGVIAGLGALGSTAAGAVDTLRGAPPASGKSPAPTPNVYDQYADLQKRLPPAEAAPDAPKEDRLLGMDRERLRNLLLQTGAGLLAGTSPYAGVNLGKALMLGLDADQKRQLKLEERAAKAEENEKTRAEKQYEARVKAASASLKQTFPDFEKSGVDIDALANYAALKGMAPRARKVAGYDDETFKEIERTAQKLMGKMSDMPKGNQGSAGVPQDIKDIQKRYQLGAG